MTMKLNLNKGQKLWYTSDTHYNHANICSATTKWADPLACREFKSLEHMNAHLVGNINEVVGQDDILFHLGDWSFGGFEQIQEFRDSIVCKNVHIITGNHDHHIENNKEYNDLGKCKKSGYFLPNTLGTVNFYALSCRIDEKICGKNGIKFESNK